jgi:uncharacterized protein YecE (DUF72 family)
MKKRSQPRSDVRIGISGWTYAPWRGTFFPGDLVQRKELEYASRRVRTIEINGTFYSLQRPSSYAKWAGEVPDDFLFSVKAPRYITHIRRLKDVEVPLANFFASGVLGLGSKLGPILWQLPPSLPYRREILAAFLRLLPRDTVAAARLARKHDENVKQPFMRSGPSRPLRHALEVRHHSFNNPEFIALLREHSVAIVVADTAGKWPVIEDVTAGFVYVRLHGDAELYVSGYTPSALKNLGGEGPRLGEGKRRPAGQAGGPRFPAGATAGRLCVFRQRCENPRSLRRHESCPPAKTRSQAATRPGCGLDH